MSRPQQPQPLDLTPIKAYLEVAAKLGYAGCGLRHMAALVDEVERITALSNGLMNVDGTNQALRETIAGMAGERLELLGENERLTNRLNWLERAIGQKPDFTGVLVGGFRCVCCGQVASKSEAHRCEKGGQG
jgi:hypothetical protein